MYLWGSLRLYSVSSLSVASWNVNGIRSLLKYDAEIKTLNEFIAKRSVDILCLQETKLQSIHVQDVEKVLRSKIPITKCFWNCSTTRKGYSGTAIFILSNSIDIDDSQVSCGISDDEGDGEGRSITLCTDSFSVVNVYVPNAGSDLKRLNYRTNIWDRKLADHIVNLKNSKSGRKVILAGDMNVAHEAIDYHNSLDIRTRKQPGTTPQEQQSFKDNFLERCQLVDTFRSCHGNRRSYSFFSGRLGERGRTEKMGMRLDYMLLGGTVSDHAKANETCDYESYIEEQVD